MPIQSGTRLGPYEILALVGAGGMGEVYRARDTRLERIVAVKVLPPHSVDNSEMTLRFEREARTIAGLNHPHICTLYDVGREGSVGYLVMEFLEGETLAQRLARGLLPIEEALRYAVEIADALDKAHAQGVVHRDLKPSNIMLTRSGTKLMDFGLAKLKPSPDTSLGTSMMPTVGNDMTTPGMIVGTVQYMSPEQLEGKDADNRADIFALGMVVYEMITGRKAFEGKSRAILMAAILTGDPPSMMRIQPAAPPALDHAVKRCLAKDPEDRWQTAHDLAVQVEWIARSGKTQAVSIETATQQRRRERRDRIFLPIAGLLVLALAVPAVLYVRGADVPDAFHIRIPVSGLNADSIAISPDGKTIAVVAQPNTAEAAALFVRSPSGVTSKRLGGTDDASQPFWSPDSRFIGFFARGKLKKIEATGGPAQELATEEDFSGGSWSPDNTILFGSPKGIMRVSAEGGKPEQITTVGKEESGHLWPSFLPGGRHFLYLAWSNQPGNRAVYAGSLDSTDKTKILAAESNVRYAAPGFLVFHREATVFAQPFNAKKLALTGDAVQLAGVVRFNAGDGHGAFDVSQNGSLLYYEGSGVIAANRAGFAGAADPVQLGWRDRTGDLVGGGAGEAGVYGEWDVSSDGKLIAVSRQDTGTATSDIWVIDWQRAGVATRLTLDPADDFGPVWSPDGSRIAFTTYRKGNADIHIKNANGVGAEMPLLESKNYEAVEAWSKDGRYIAYKFGQNAEVPDLYAAPLFGDGKPFPIVEGPFQKDEPQFSPDGKWIAYTSNETGTFQVYVVSFPMGDQKLMVSREGGGQPRWRPDGKELYFRPVTIPGGIMTVEIRTTPKLDAAVPKLLFTPADRNGQFAIDPVRHRLGVSPDGQKVLLRVNLPTASTATQAPVPTAPTTFVPPGQPAQAAAASGGTRNGNSLGLTVVLQWPAILQKASP